MFRLACHALAFLFVFTFIAVVVTAGVMLVMRPAQVPAMMSDLDEE